LNSGPSSGWLSAEIVIGAVLGAACLAALAPVERRRTAPMLRLGLFRSRQFDAINATTVLFYGALGAASYLVVVQCQLRLGYSATQAGAALIPESVVFAVVAPFSGRLVARLGPRWLMVVGMLAVAAALAWLAQADPGDDYATAILPGALLWGLGIGLAVTPLTAAVLAAVGDADLGEASAVNDAASRVGGVIAIALIPALIGGGGLAGALADGYGAAMMAMAGLCVAGALVTAVWVSDARAGAAAAAGAPRAAPHPATHACALPATDTIN
jgi:predicted MFS family arabinose efflux permease